MITPVRRTGTCNGNRVERCSDGCLGDVSRTAAR